MTKAHHRRKQPEAVRQQLLTVAARLSLEKGPANVTLDAVSQAAGVSKGGLLHHFPSKLALLDGLFDDLVDRLDGEIDTAMRSDAEPRGRFTRAYISVCLAPGGQATGAGWKTLTIALLAEPHLRGRWRRWVERRADEHVGTDSSVEAELARFAADGLWLAELLESHDLEPGRHEALMRRLIDLSRL